MSQDRPGTAVRHNATGKLLGPRRRSRAVLWAPVALLPLLAACGLNPFAEEEQVGPLADSAARASLQTNGLLVRALKQRERAIAEAAAEQEDPGEARQIAALPPENDPGVALRLRLPPNRTQLDPGAQADLAALSTQLQREADLPIRILAYWSAENEDEAGTAKLRALKRAMLVRDFLVGQGVARAPIDFPRIESEAAVPGLVDVVVSRR